MNHNHKNEYNNENTTLQNLLLPYVQMQYISNDLKHLSYLRIIVFKYFFKLEIVSLNYNNIAEINLFDKKDKITVAVES